MYQSMLMGLLLLLLLSQAEAKFLFVKPQLDECIHQWLHPPKTGSTFCLSIQHACNETDFTDKVHQHTELRTYKGCARLFPNELSTYHGTRWHLPLFKRDFSNLQSFVTVLRNPRSRTISSFCDHMHMDGMKKTEGLRVKAKIQEISDSQSATMCKDASHPNTRGCYTKMLTGHGCFENVTLTSVLLKQAIKNLSLFSFVGILEDYEKSVDLFLTLNKVNVSAPALPVEKVRVRGGDTNLCSPSKHGFCLNTNMVNLAAAYVDDYDQKVYDYAKQRFYWELARHGMSI